MTKGIDFTGIAVAATIYHPDKGILFGMRTEQCRDEPNVRDNRGGGLKFGEKITDGMKRELKEETWRDFQDNQIHFLWHREQLREHEGKKTHWIGFYHLTILRGDEVITNMEPHKHDELRYFQIDTLPIQQESHSMLYPTLIEFKEKIEKLIDKTITI